jgi:4a-hydroxytetrahydrobiopterin dehydratase
MKAPAMIPLLQQHCEARQTADCLNPAQCEALWPQLPGWSIQGPWLEKTFRFRHYHDTLAFVNALAWVAHQEDHHPELVVNYASCTVRWNTHSAGGITLNDFIAAARVNALLPDAA